MAGVAVVCYFWLTMIGRSGVLDIFWETKGLLIC